FEIYAEAASQGIGPSTSSSAAFGLDNFYLERQIRPTIDSLIRAVNEAVANGTLTGTGPGRSQDGRLNAWVNMLNASQLMIESGNVVGVCDQLRDAYGFIDGLPEPPDLVTGSAAPALAALIQAVRTELGCF